jgi:hypothetical protein
VKWFTFLRGFWNWHVLALPNQGSLQPDRPSALTRLGRNLTRFGSRAFRFAVVHNAPVDAQREYAYGPANRLTDTKVGAFTQALYDEAKQKSWTVISMKNDWKHIFAFE